MIDRFQQISDLSRIVHNSFAFGQLLSVDKDKAQALVQTAAGRFTTPPLTVLNRIKPAVGESCLVLAPQGKVEQGALLCLGVDPELLEVLKLLAQRLDVLEQPL